MINTSKLFGSEEKFKSLVCVHKYYTKLNRNNQKYLSSMISDLNRITFKVSNIKDRELFNYLIFAIRRDFTDKNKSFCDRIKSGEYDEELNAFSTHLQNFITAKIREIINENK